MSVSSNEAKETAAGVNMSDTSIQAKDTAESVSSGSSCKRRVASVPGLKRKSQNRPSVTIAGSLISESRQRVLSARQHRQKSLQNQMSELLQQNAELMNENRLFRTLHKRQDNALAKFENSSTELPQIIKSHAEELRVWHTKCRSLNVQNRELNKKIQQKDKTINELSDRVKHLTSLTAEKHLEEREALTIKVDALERKLDEKEEEIKLLTRRNTLEAKNFKTQLANERKKYKESCQKQSIEKPSGKSSSHSSDYSSAKDLRLVKSNPAIHAMANTNATPDLTDETPPIEMNVDTDEEDDDDDDDDLVIKTIMEKDSKTDRNSSLNEPIVDAMKQLAELQLFASKKAQNIHNIHHKIKNDIKKNEALLDLHCDEISRDIGVNHSNKKKILFDDESVNEIIRDDANIKVWNGMMSSSNETFTTPKIATPVSSERVKSRPTSNLPRFNINLASQQVKRIPIDPQKKNKMMTQIKPIDTTNGSL